MSRFEIIYTYNCKGIIKKLKDNQKTKIVGNMFFVICINCHDIPVTHILIENVKR